MFWSETSTGIFEQYIEVYKLFRKMARTKATFRPTPNASLTVQVVENNGSVNVT